MAVTFSITPGTTTLSYEELDSTAGRKALFCRVDSPHYARTRFHPFGVDGNYIVRGGRNGGVATCRMRYIGAPSSIYVALAADQAACSDTAATIADEYAVSHIGCNLRVNGFRRISDMKSCGWPENDTYCWFDAEAVFDIDR